VIETARLRLRRLSADDEHALVELDSDPDVMRWVGSPPGCRPHAETVERVRQRIGADHGALGFWVVEGRDGGGAIGLVALLPMPAGGDIELAYRLARRAWGRGLATEAASAIIAYAFGAARLPRLVAVTYPDNVASQRVLARLGFTPAGAVDYKGVRAAQYVLAPA